jgi:hypothetical protein
MMTDALNPTISLTELRQRLFELADHVADTGEPLVILRNGVRLRLVRDEVDTMTGGRLARLVAQSLVIGAPLEPDESPAQWNAELQSKVAEPAATYGKAGPRGRRRR